MTTDEIQIEMISTSSWNTNLHNESNKNANLSMINLKILIQSTKESPNFSQTKILLNFIIRLSVKVCDLVLMKLDSPTN